jgi:GT2 family glycosyltransferase
MHVSVIMPVYNCERYIAEAVNSVLRQTHHDFDLVLIDDGSADQAGAICEGFARHDPRITLVRRENRGICNTLNEALSLARSEWVAVMHCDDVMMPNRLERQIAFVEAHPELAIISSMVEWIDGEGRHVGWNRCSLTTPQAVDEARRDGGTIAFPHPAVMFRKSVIQSLGGYRQFAYPVEDCDLWNRAADAGHRVLVQDEVLLKYRMHPAASTYHKAAEVARGLRWIGACAIARRAGEPEPTREAFEAAEAALPWPAKLNEWRKQQGDVAWTRAMACFAGRRMAALVPPLAMAVALRPGTYVPRILPRLLGRGDTAPPTSRRAA